MMRQMLGRGILSPMKTESFRPVAIVGGVRIPFCKQGTGYRELSILDLMGGTLSALVEKYALKGQVIDDVALGTVFYHPSTWNFAREAVLRSGLSWESPGLGVQRACATSLEAAVAVAHKIATGRIDCAIAGGAESMSNVAIYYHPNFSRRLVGAVQAKSVKDRLTVWKGLKLSDLKPMSPPAVESSTGLSMGQHCEVMAKEWKITRKEQDTLALKSHQTGAAAYKKGFYKDLICSFEGVQWDNNLREDTTEERMAKLKPAFDRSGEGTLTAGNSSPLTDGAACVLLASEEWAKKRGLPVLAYLTDFETTAVDFRTEGLLMAPAYAVPKMLKRQGLKLQDYDFYEIHEAFAAQVLCTLKAWESEKFCKDRLKLDQPLGSIPMDKLNVVGGSVALGHPFGATGARMLATAGKLLAEKGSGKALLSVCAGGGMGTVAQLER